MTKRTLDQTPSKVELDRQPDDALKQTFPASDPITVGVVQVWRPFDYVGRVIARRRYGYVSEWRQLTTWTKPANVRSTRTP